MGDLIKLSMIKKTTLKIISCLLLIILFGNFISPLSVFAQEAPASPSAPVGPSSAPAGPSSAPEGPSSAPSAPSGPSSAPSGPSSAPTNPSSPSGPSTSDSSPLPTNTPSGNSSGYTPSVTPYDSDPTPTETSTSASGTTGVSGTSGEIGPTGSTGTNEGLQTGTSGTYPESPGNTDSANFSNGDFSTSANDPYNSVTGPGSTNYGAEIINKQTAEVNKNLADLDNKINSLLRTGFNNANYNTLNGQVFTGDAKNTLNLMNKLNSNLSGIGAFNTMNLYGNYSGDIALNFSGGSPLSNFVSASDTLAANSVTGPLSANYSVTDGNFTVKEANGNDAKLNNDIYLNADTGHNSTSLNTGAGVIQTGDATALANIINMVNTNIQVDEWLFAVINIFGDLAGNIILPGGTNLASVISGSNNVGNSETGPSSYNYSASTTNSTTDINNTNDADISSNLAVSAKTGNNDASFNTGGGYVNTGVADSSLANTTIANTNTYDPEGTVFLVIVNELGKWVGHIIGGNSASSGNSETENAPALNAQNNATGPLSNNVSEIKLNSDTTLTNNNNADITNNIKISANTGSNDASKNTGPGIIETGDANAGLSLLNLANTNIIAKKLVVLFVNVIGNFIGDIIPSGESQTKVGDNFALGNGSFSQNSTENSLPIPTNSSNQNVGGNEQALLTAQSEDQARYETIYYYYYPDDYNWSTYNPFLNIATKKSGKYKQSLLTNANQLPEVSVDPSKLTRGTTFSTAFVKAVQSSAPATLVSGISLKVTYSWLLVLPLAITLYIYRRRNRIGIDIHRYINMLLDIIL